MLVAYLDDSGTDDGCPVVTMAGYVGLEDAWRAFEADVAPVFANYKMRILHAKDLHNTRGYFEGWSHLKKRCFVKELYMQARKHLILGMSISVRKQSYSSSRVVEVGLGEAKLLPRSDSSPGR